MTLIAEDLLLDDESGTVAASTYLQTALGGALLAGLERRRMVQRTVDHRRRSSSEVRKRAWALARETAEGDWAAKAVKAVKDAIAAATAAMTAAVTAGGAAAAGAS